MSTCTETTDWGPITRGTRFDVDIELPDLDDPAAAYDLTGLVARVQLRERSAAGGIILTGRSDDAEPVISIASPATTAKSRRSGATARRSPSNSAKDRNRFAAAIKAA